MIICKQLRVPLHTDRWVSLHYILSLLIQHALQPSMTARADLGAMQSNHTASTTPSAEEQRKHEQQKQLEALRKKLLAKRGASARPDTPSKTPVSFDAPPPQHRMEQQENSAAARPVNQHINDDFGIESLLAEGKAAAEAKVARDNQAAAAAVALAATMNQSANTNHQPVAATGPANMEVDELKPESLQEKSTEPIKSVVSPTQKPADHKQNNTFNPHPVNMSDPYYDDLAVWLEFTGYHDVQFRNSKLSTYKQRRELEQQAAQIAQKLEELKQVEKADLESLRPTVAHPNVAPRMAPPPLPANMPAGDHRNHTNGLKRPHSPEPSTIEKSSRKANDPVGDFRIRGANGASATSPRENGSPLQRRDFPERRRSINERHERDPSLERRQQHYTSRDPPTPRANGRGGHHQGGAYREGPRPFNARDRERERDGRPGFSAVNRVGGPAHGGNVGLDLRKGGQSNSHHYR